MTIKFNLMILSNKIVYTCIWFQYALNLSSKDFILCLNPIAKPRLIPIDYASPTYIERYQNYLKVTDPISQAQA